LAKYPRPIPKDQPQAGKFMLHPLPLAMFIEVQGCPGQERMLPAFTSQDTLFLKTMGIWLDFSFDP